MTFCLFDFIVIIVPPVLKKQPTLIQAIPGEDREVLCTLHEGNPHPTFVWQAQPNTCDPETKTDCTPIEEDWVTVEKVCLCKKFFFPPLFLGCVYTYSKNVFKNLIHVIVDIHTKDIAYFLL